MMLHDRTWLLIGRRLANEASPQEISELEEILRHDPELHFTLQALYEVWNPSTGTSAAELESAYKAHLRRMHAAGTDLPQTDQSTYGLSSDPHGHPDTQRPVKLKRVLAGLAIAAMIAAVTWQILPSGESAVNTKPAIAAAGAASEISTRNGSRTNIALPDGTKVWLNAGSKLTYGKEFNENTRNVKLTGEAYFDVAHNAAKPFIIHTDAMDIKVLGTEFNVKSYPGENTTETSLIRGSIEVTLNDKRAERIVLKPLEKLVVINEQQQAVRSRLNKKADRPIISLGHLNYYPTDSTIIETSWVQNRLVFEDESFQEVALRMERWYGVRFSFADPATRQLRFTGNFRNETLEEALAAMQITADFTYIISEKTVTINK